MPARSGGGPQDGTGPVAEGARGVCRGRWGMTGRVGKTGTSSTAQASRGLVSHCLRFRAAIRQTTPSCVGNAQVYTPTRSSDILRKLKSHLALHSSTVRFVSFCACVIRQYSPKLRWSLLFMVLQTCECLRFNRCKNQLI